MTVLCFVDPSESIAANVTGLNVVELEGNATEMALVECLHLGRVGLYVL